MNREKYNQNLIRPEFFEGKELEAKPTRDAYGDALVELAKDDPRIVALNANLEGSVRHTEFAKQFPDRYFQVGVAEQNLADISLGLALYGKIPFFSSFAAFSPGINFSQIRLACISGANIKVASTHYGLNIGPDGVTAQMLEDISLMRSLPNMTIITPADYSEGKVAMKKVAEHVGPVYIRFTREKFPIFMQENLTFEIGKNQVLRYGNDISIFATGSTVYTALEVSKLLEEKGIDAEIVNVSSIKPIDVDQIVESTSKTKRAITIEEHSSIGGLGSAVSEVLTDKNPVKLLRIGTNNFGESGEPKELLESRGLSASKLFDTIVNHINS